MLIPTTTSEPPSIAYLTRSWGILSSESHWRSHLECVIERCEGLEWQYMHLFRHSRKAVCTGPWSPKELALERRRVAQVVDSNNKMLRSELPSGAHT